MPKRFLFLNLISTDSTLWLWWVDFDLSEDWIFWFFVLLQIFFLWKTDLQTFRIKGQYFTRHLSLIDVNSTFQLTWTNYLKDTVESVLVAAASNHFDEIFDQNLLSKKWILLRLLFEGGFYLRAASNNVVTVYDYYDLFNWFYKI